MGLAYVGTAGAVVWQASANPEEDQKRRIRELASAFRNKMDKADTITKQLMQRQSDKNFRKRALDTLV